MTAMDEHKSRIEEEIKPTRKGRAPGNILKGIVGIYIFAAFAVSTLAGFPQSLKATKWWKNPNVATAIGLTTQQIEQIERVWVESRNHLLDLKVEVDKEQEALQGLLSQDSDNNQQVLVDRIHRVTEARAKLMETNLIRIYKMKKILTAEQRLKLRDFDKRPK